MYKLYYNRRCIGDVLIIEIEKDIMPDKYIKKDDVVSLYKGDELVGINIFNFSRIIKIFHEGEIENPPKELIEVINHILINSTIKPLEGKQYGRVRN